MIPSLLGGLVESTRLSPCRDVRLGTPVEGVQISNLRTRLRLYEGQVAVRRLSPPLRRAQIESLNNFVEEVHGRPFNESKRVSAKAARRRNPPGDGSSYFCSELVAEAYQRIGLLPSPPAGPSSSNYIPADFSSCYTQACFPLHSEYCLEAERTLRSRRAHRDRAKNQ